LKKDQQIQEIDFTNRYEKDFEFAVVTNKQALRDDVPENINPFKPTRALYYSILFILEGNGQHHIDFQRYNYKRGSIIFVAKGQVQSFIRNVNRRAIFFGFTEKFLEKNTLGSNLIQQINLYNYHLYPPLLQLEESEIHFFEVIANRISDEFHAPDDFATEEIIASLLKMFLLLAERIRKKTTYQSAHPTYYPTFLNFQKLLDQYLLTNRKVIYYAQLMQISTKKLNRITQEVIQKPAKQYIHERLIMEMKRLLMNTDLSIKEIAYQSGFDEPTNFVKYFKKETSMTPSSFRNNFNKN